MAITVYSNTVLASGNALPQWQDTTGANVQSIVISNDSISALVYEVAGVQEIVPANTLFTAPIAPNTTFRIYGQTAQPSLLTSPTYPQLVTVDTSPSAVIGATSSTIRPGIAATVSPNTVTSSIFTLKPTTVTQNSIILPATPGTRYVLDGVSIFPSDVGNVDFPSALWAASLLVQGQLGGINTTAWGGAVGAGNPSAEIDFATPFQLPTGYALRVVWFASSGVAGTMTFYVVLRYHTA